MSYKDPIPPDEDRQCFECKHSHYDSIYNYSTCGLNHGHGTWNKVNPMGTCDDWEPKQ